MIFKLKITDISTMEAVIEERTFDNIETALKYISDIESDKNKIVRHYEISTKKRIIGGEL